MSEISCKYHISFYPNRKVWGRTIFHLTVHLPLLRLIVAGFAVLGPATDAFAQVITDDVIRDAERLQEREAERLRELDETLNERQIVAPNGVDADTAADDGAEKLDGCVAVSTTRITGMTLYDPDDYLRQTAQLTGPCTPLSSIDELLRSITNRYVSDGYLTSRALIASKELEQSVLNIVVVEGKLGGIDSEGIDGARPFSRRELSLTFPSQVGEPLNLRDLEQGVDQLARLRSSAAKVDIIPAAEPGASDLLVKRIRLRRAVRPSFEYSNDGSDFSGREIGTFVLDVDSPLGLADFWSVFYSRDLIGDEQRGSEAFGGFVSLPLGYTTLNVSVSRSEFRSVLVSNGLAFSNTGRTYNGSLTANHLVYRDQDTKVSLSGGLGIFDTETRIQSIRLSTNSYRLVEARAGVSVQHRALDGLLGASLDFSRGLAILGAQVVDTGPDGPTTGYRKFAATLQYSAPVKILQVPFVYRSFLRGQFSLDPLLPAERLNLGGQSTVRGFRIDGTSGRNGIFVRNEYDFDLFDMFTNDPYGQTISVGLLLGHDVGRIFSDNDNIFERGSLQSATIALEMRSPRLQVQLSYSEPISRPFFIRRDRAELSVSARLTI